MKYLYSQKPEVAEEFASKTKSTKKLPTKVKKYDGKRSSKKAY